MKTISSLQHPLVKHLVKLRKNGDYRIDHQTLLVEGVKLLKEAASHLTIKTLVVEDATMIPKGLKAAEVVISPPAVIEKISGVASPEGILAEVVMPKPPSLKGAKRIIGLEGINDPGNLGTLLRTALALGWDGAFILHDSCDPYNEKALRAARGATFKLPIAMGSWEDLEKIIKQNKLTPLAADLEGTAVGKLSKENGLLLVLGNEANGLSAVAEERCRKVTIPMAGKMESLNVAIAGGILMYALTGER